MTEIIAGVFIPDSAMACEGMHFMSSVCGRGRWSLVSCRTGGRLRCETWRESDCERNESSWRACYCSPVRQAGRCVEVIKAAQQHGPDCHPPGANIACTYRRASGTQRGGPLLDRYVLVRIPSDGARLQRFNVVNSTNVDGVSNWFGQWTTHHRPALRSVRPPATPDRWDDDLPRRQRIVHLRSGH
jgi:hypothetical protein